MRVMSTMNENRIEVQELETLRAELLSAKKKVGALQQQVKQMEELIYLKCAHDWIVDHSNVGEHTEYVCTKCHMSKK